MGRSRPEEFDEHALRGRRLATAQAHDVHQRCGELVRQTDACCVSPHAPGQFEHSGFHPDALQCPLAERLCTSAIGEPLLALLDGYRLHGSTTIDKTGCAAETYIHGDYTLTRDPGQVALNN